MTLPERIQSLLSRAFAALHPCLYGPMGGGEADALAAKPKRTRKPRAKKEAAPAAEKVKEAVKKTVTRKPRKKAVVPSFVIQNSAEDGITYEDVVAKVQAAITVADVTSLDIYVKAEEGKAYYVVNGEAAGAVDLF